jgi:GntR family transcriptional regulator/MocR family aminotransferase
MKPRPRKAPVLGIALDGTQPKALYQQICQQLRLAILERRLAPDTRLPSSRMMAAELHCARGTVLAAIDQLVAEGYLVARSASGVTVATTLPDDTPTAPFVDVRASHCPADLPILPERTRALLGRHIPLPTRDIPLAFPVGQPDHSAFPFPLWAKLLEKEWRRPAWHIAGASHPFGDPALREAIASYLGAARGFTCAPEAIVITTGLQQSASLFARIVLEAGETVWIEEPGYPGLREALAMARVRAIPVPIDEYGFSTEKALSLAPEARLALVAPSHHYPLGTVLSLPRRLALLNWAERTKSWVIEDDFDSEYRYAGRPLAPLRVLDRTGRVAYLASFSKLLFQALRLSFLVLPDSLVETTERVMASISTRASLLGQAALARFIADGHLAAHLRRTRLLYAGRQQALIAAARRHLAGQLDVEPDAGGMHLIARPHRSIAADFDDFAVTLAAARKGVQVAPLSHCYAGSAKAQGLLLGYACTPEAEIESAVANLSTVLKHHR